MLGAIRAFERSIAIEPRYADPYYPLGQLTATELHNPARGADLLGKAIRLNPAHRQAAAAQEMIRRLSSGSDTSP
jgi:hypothetical protein